MKKGLTYENILKFYRSLNKRNQRELYNSLVIDIGNCKMKDNLPGKIYCNQCIFFFPMSNCLNYQKEQFTPEINKFINYLKLKYL